MTTKRLKDKITKLFATAFPAATKHELDLIPRGALSGKLYEAYVLARIAGKLRVAEGMSLRLCNSRYLQLKSSPGPINPAFPHIEAYRAGNLIGKIWTDVEFLSLSFAISGARSPGKGDYHELDIVMAKPNAIGRPRHDQVMLGVECKHRRYLKEHLRGILGVRRELSVLTNTLQHTNFVKWPTASLPTRPPSCLMAYSSDVGINNYSSSGRIHGIQFVHETL